MNSESRGLSSGTFPASGERVERIFRDLRQCPRAPGATRVRRSRALIRDPARLRFAVSRRGAAPRWVPGCSRAPRRRMRLGIPRRTSRSRRTTTFTCAPGTSSTTPRSNARFTTTSSGRRRTSSSRSASTAWTRTTARPSSASSPISRTNVIHPPGTPPPLARTSSSRSSRISSRTGSRSPCTSPRGTSASRHPCAHSRRHIPAAPRARWSHDVTAVKN
mmetsp:Transcript_9438/g.38591  ORF Transcript_9438/g.38591 Transcript_9438/m.38591 type:complete len:219 (+) Transcript_9438:414-1070(+)